MLYDVSVRIGYSYDNAAESGRHVLRLLPADLPGEQRLIAGSLDIVPVPDEQIFSADFFGNRVMQVAILAPHSQIAFSMNARVERLRSAPANAAGVRLDELGAQIAACRDVSADSPHHFTAASERVSISRDIAQYARAHTDTGASVADNVRALGEALHRDMTFDPEATSVDTPMEVAFAARRGVCQDFTHIMIACLRSRGIPAGYVSGFLRTVPPPGQPRLDGADAMHAWVRAWCGGEAGWTEYDPTNAAAVGRDHIVVARGRDYADIVPVHGLMRSYGAHTTRQSVDVIPHE